MGNASSTETKNHRTSARFGHPHGNLRSNIVPELKRDISLDFERLKEIGGGKMGKVYTAKKSGASILGSTKMQYAIKECITSRGSNKHFAKCLRVEIDALKALDHPNIIKPYAVYYTNENLNLVLQNCTGGNLYNGFKVDPATNKKIPFSEKRTAEIIHQVLSAVAHMHSHGVCHRDIKFENILFETQHPDSKIKLIDFGIAQNVKVMFECCGTTYTMATEVLTLKGYTNKVDLWSVGVIVYMMLSLTKPFYGKDKMTITNKILKGDFRYYSPNWESRKVSNDAKSFIEALIEKNPQKRLSATKAMKHKWLTKEISESANIWTTEIIGKVFKSIKQYPYISLLKTIVLVIIAHHLTTEETIQIHQVFEQFDRTRFGEIHLADFTSAMRQIDSHSTDDDILLWFKNLNVYKDGDISYTEFLASCLESFGCLTDDYIDIAFQRLDTDLTGGISRSNLQELFGSDFKVWNVEKIWSMNSYDDQITLDDFRIICRTVNDKEESSCEA